MHIKTRNVNTAFQELVFGIHSGEIETRVQPSRNGEVLSIPEPVTITYEKPTERVLFNQARDCNPFFHMYESLWMLAGRNDVAPLAYYNSQMSQFSDDGKTFNGAYGWRWKRYPNPPDISNETWIDQLKILIHHLKENPYSRRAVLNMWNVEDDLLKIDDQFDQYSKDVCCNLSVKFSIDDGGDDRENATKYLKMTVFNRSNDLIWGCLGANVVHFSFLQEYVASHLGLEVGVYNQIADDLHTYTERWEPEKWLDEDTFVGFERRDVEFGDGPPKPYSLIRHPEQFDLELPKFVERYSKDCIVDENLAEPFLVAVAQPMLQAFHAHKRREYDLCDVWLPQIGAEDWRIVATNWIQKRRDNWEQRKRSDRRLEEAK